MPTKLMVATEFAPNASGGGPAIVRQLLRGWPVEHLHWWSCLPELDSRFGLRVAEHRCAPIPDRLMPHRRLTQIKSALLETFWAPRAAAHLARSIQEVQPDVVWVILHSWAILPLHAVLRSGATPFHATIHDYMDLPGNAARMGRDRSVRLAKMADQLYAHARTRDAISHSMIADLKERTGAMGQVLHAGVEAADFAFLENKADAADAEIRIAYAGTILVEPEFALFVEALQKARQRIDRPVSLQLFGSHSYATRPWFRSEWMTEHGNLAEPELLRALRGCTFGFSPMALTGGDDRYSRYSFPTKFISYLAAGLPIISLAHPESSLMKMTSEFRVGPTIRGGSSDEIADYLVRTLSDKNPWTLYGPEILRCARAEFDAERTRRNFYQALEHGPASPAAEPLARGGI